MRKVVAEFSAEIAGKIRTVDAAIKVTNLKLIQVESKADDSKRKAMEKVAADVTKNFPF